MQVLRRSSSPSLESPGTSASSSSSSSSAAFPSPPYRGRSFSSPQRVSTPRLPHATFDQRPAGVPRKDSMALSRDLPAPMHVPVPTRGDWPLKAATSIPDLRESQSQPRPRRPYTLESSRSSVRRKYGQRRQSSLDDLRTSYRSVTTTASSACLTERSSVATKNTSLSDITQPTSIQDDSDDEGMSVEDAISMYAQGFSDEPQQQQQQQRSALAQPSSDSGYYSQIIPNADDEEPPPPIGEAKLSKSTRSSRPLPDAVTRVPSIPELPQQTPAAPPELNSRPLPARPRSILKSKPTTSRDRYGFKKATQSITEAEHNAWSAQYEEHLSRRRKKWNLLMAQHGLSTDNPVRFPGRSDKVKRYIRKGIPPEWRGAAWFWYAGGPVRITQRPGLYPELLKLADEGGLSEHDREQMERDLNRTFPDNIKFRPDVPTSGATPGEQFNPNPEHDTPIVNALRRVLKAFAVNNPSIGYCQSLNFLAGLLLLFLDSDEEKAFILLSILCNEFLPGAHGRVLEASVEVGVLMTCIRETMPAVWEKIDDQPQVESRSPPGGLARLPTVSLATTAWFMSCFIGNLPIEAVLRVWDCLFYEGSKTLFRIALTIFKLGETQIRAVSENLEIFQVVQQIPRNLIDPNVLMEACYRRRNGFGHLSQDAIDTKRKERRAMVKDGAEAKKQGTLRRAASRARLKRSVSKKRG